MHIIKATDSDTPAKSTTAVVALTIAPAPLNLSISVLPNATFNQPYNTTLPVLGGTARGAAPGTGRAALLLVLPVGRESLLSHVVHALAANLHLNRFSSGISYYGMQRLITIGFRNRYVIGELFS